ncbi:sensor histidine kinase [Salinibius halmophilus]|uniref:sensor histidine kinase n=1 Tax=Salinibius halmophilus TaxID=1853216 RepID=UPI000E674763|nr:sensor histidine kinase [Salinibius halmophilus]
MSWQLILQLVQQMSVFLVLAYVFSKSPLFKPLMLQSGAWQHKLSTYLVFSSFCILGSYLGYEVQDAIANTRAIGAVVGGLLGGPVIGLAVGLTGGVHRYTLGGFTDVACMISTTMAGLIAGLVSRYRLKRGRSVLSPLFALQVTLVVEVLQMLLLLVVAKPFDEAWQLVQSIAAPMLIANSVGAALFIRIIRDQQTIDDRLSAQYSQKALDLAQQTVGVLANGLTKESAETLASVLYHGTGVAAVAVTDQKQVLAFYGAGREFHPAGSAIQSDETLQSLANNEVVFSDGKQSLHHCQNSLDCPLGAGLVVPLHGEHGSAVGTIKLYEYKQQLFSNLNRSLGEGIARVLSNQMLYGRLRSQREMLTETELKLARAQVNPHFLFNTLNTIAAVIRHDANMARTLVLSLSGYLRNNLKRNDAMSSICDELQHARYYLTIEQARLGERLTIVEQVNEHCNLTLPTLTLQPLVENAIKHGVSKVPGKQTLKLIVEQIPDGWHIEVTDSAGLYRDQANGRDSGIGMNMVEKRLHAAYGNQATVAVTVTPNIETRVTITIKNQATALAS